MHLLSFGWDVAFRIDEDVIFGPGRDAVDQLDATDFDQPVALARIESRRFGIEHYLPQHSAVPPSRR